MLSVRMGLYSATGEELPFLNLVLFVFSLTEDASRLK